MKWEGELWLECEIKKENTNNFVFSFYKKNNAFIMCYVSFMFALNFQLIFVVPADNSTEFKIYGAHNSASILQTILNLLYFGLMYILWTSKSSFEQQQ